MRRLLVSYHAVFYMGDDMAQQEIDAALRLLLPEQIARDHIDVVYDRVRDGSTNFACGLPAPSTGHHTVVHATGKSS